MTSRAAGHAASRSGTAASRPRRPRHATPPRAARRAAARTRAPPGALARAAPPASRRPRPPRIARDRPARAHRPDALDQLQHAEPRDVVGAVVDQAQRRHEVLDVRGLEVAQAAVLVERDPAAGELELQQVGVVRRARQHGLGAQLHALLARLEDAVADLLGLRGLVAHPHDARPHAARRGPRADASGTRARPAPRRAFAASSTRLRRAVVALQRHHARAREVLREVEDVRRRGRAEAVDRLEVVADRGDRRPVRAQRAREVDLQPVDVLVLVDQHVVERRRRAAARSPRRAASARQNSSRSSRSSTPSARLRAV